MYIFNGFCITKVKFRHECYYQQLLLAGCIIKRAGFASMSDVPTKIASLYNFLQYLGKYAFVRLATRFWKVPWQTNPNVLNKWHLKFPCAYLNA
ncbi:hypothetical protein T02_8495 [Trichinella nativa]|uniref:Uncharacterized protein n=1 Tax=Trichinella nativa TaxID=6335 RepID=A0A0V1LEW6_9BILA|nr:hypothetical protein T02_8495 [Trichinella nativa]